MPTAITADMRQPTVGKAMEFNWFMARQDCFHQIIGPYKGSSSVSKIETIDIICKENAPNEKIKNNINNAIIPSI